VTATTPVPAVSGEAAGTGLRTWRIEMPAGMDLLNSNDRDGHWARRKRITAALRETAAWLAKAQRIPRLERAHVLAYYEPPDRRKRDPGNWYPSFKACIDGIVEDAGVLPGDDAQYLDGPDPRLGERHPRGRIVLVITELTP
jgi:crossover junction endodeoxyribonuclease RusA